MSEINPWTKGFRQWMWRPSQSSDWIETSGEPEFDIRTNIGGQFATRDFVAQVEGLFSTLDEAKAWCQRQQAERDQ